MLGLRHVVAVSALVLGLAAAGAGARAADTDIVDGPKLNWKVGLWGKPRANTTHAEILKKHLEARTGGKWTVTLGYDAFGSPKELPDLVKIGAIQVAWIFPGYYPERFPVHSIADLPFLPLADLDAFVRVVRALEKHPAAVAEIAGWGSRAIIPGVLPQYEAIGRGKPPLKLADWKGMRVRAIGGHGEAMKLLGAIPTSMDPTDVYTALERGTVDAIFFPSTVSHGSFRLYEVGQWYTENMALGTGPNPLIANNEAYNALPPQYKKLIDEARELSLAGFKEAYREIDEKYLPLFRKRLKFIHYDEAELAQFRKVAGEPLWNQWVEKVTAQGIPGRELLDLVLKAARGEAS